MSWAELPELCGRLLERRRAEGLLRSRRVVRPLSAVELEVDGRRMVNFASNDYLGLSHHPQVIEAAIDAARRWGAGSGASALISGHGQEHAAAEQAIAQWKGAGGAVLLPSGYQANVAAVQTLAALGESRPGGVRFLMDRLVHASLLDAVRGSERRWRVFPHNNMAKLRRLLEDAPRDELQVVVSESVFSMDGDFADLPGLAQLKRERPFVLLLDEAHGSGVYGPAGEGYAAECHLAGAVDVSVVTLSKALGVSGGAVCGSAEFCQSLVNVGRSYIFSTSVSPMVAAAVGAAVQVVQSEAARRERVRKTANDFRQRLSAMGFDVQPGDCPIIPIVLGEAQRTLDWAAKLAESGVLVAAVRPPTVPRGSSRLRITLSSEHAEEMVGRLLSVLERTGLKV